MKFLYFLLMICLRVYSVETFKKFEIPVDDRLPYFEKKTLSPTWEESKNIIQLNSFSLESHLKENFTDKDMKGRVSVINFFYATCNGYCPRITSNLKRVYQQFYNINQVSFYSYSVTPNIDQIDILKKYVKKHHIDGQNWHFLRGRRSVIYDIARNQLYTDLQINEEKSEDQFVHSESVYLLDQDLKLRGIYNSASKRAMEELSQDIQKLSKK